VNKGNIKVGMPMDAVFIAWGPPAQVLKGGSAAGEQIVWLYAGGYVEEVRYWGHRHIHSDYYPRTYTSAEVVFAQGVVSSWRTLPQPEY